MNEPGAGKRIAAYRYKPGQSGNPAGRKPDTEEERLMKKTAKQIIEEYKRALTEALPTIQPVFLAKALEGDMVAIKEIHDRTMDKSKQATDITSNGETLTFNVISYKENGDTSTV